MASSLHQTLSSEQVHSLLLQHRSYAQDDHPDQSSRIRQARALIEQLDPNIILQEHKEEKVYLKTFLRLFLDEAPCMEYVARAVLDDYEEVFPVGGAEGEVEKLKGLAGVWLNCFLVRMKEIRRTHTTLSPCLPSPPLDFEEYRLTPSGITAWHEQKNLTDKLLARDGYRELVRGELSLDYDQKETEEEEDQIPTISTHILPFALNSNWQSTNPPDKFKVLLDILANWSNYNIQELLKQDGINRPGNALTLTRSDSVFFKYFYLWFEPTEKPNEYKVRSLKQSQDNGRIVTFLDHNASENNIELPDPRLLQIHASIAKVLHFSGVNDLLDEVERDALGAEIELRGDGSDGAVLANRLWAFSDTISVGLGAISQEQFYGLPCV